jgi:SAM-dependent methyltransferase
MTLQTEMLSGCPICAGTRLRHLLTAPDYESRTGEYGIEECNQCGVAFTNPRPVASELPKLYDARATADFPRAGGLVRRLREFAIDRYLSSQLGTIEDAPGEPLFALDYGCGDGALAQGLARFAGAQGRTPDVTAVDFHDTPPPALAGDATITYQRNAAWHAQPGRYDAIFLRHVLEHHPEPRQLLGELNATLRPQGRLFIEVPNRRSVWATVFGGSYFGYYLPRHLMHFDATSLELLMRQAGCNSVRVARAHTPVIGRSLGYLSGRDISNTGFVGLASYPLQVILDKICGRSSTLRAAGSRD